VHGVVDFIEADVEEARQQYERPLDVIEGPADGRHEDRRRPLRRRQDVPAAGREERPRDEAAVAYLEPFMEAEKAAKADGAPRRASIVLATVKGDVHDIGKNIVGRRARVQQLRGHRPRRDGAGDRILEAAAENGVDVVGLSGLITPSLDEMVFVAREMERRGLRVPLLIGGATTSPQHTAVKIAPEYEGDRRARARRVARGRRRVEPARPAGARNAAARDRERQARLREQHARRRERPLRSFAEARPTAWRSTWHEDDLPAPAFLGRRELVDVPLATLVPYIDWTFFFHAWELKGRVPRIFEHPQYGEPRRASCTTTRRRCSPGSSTGASCAPAACTASGRPRRRRRHRAVRRRVAGDGGRAVPDAAPAGA
jgi:5-methyltetrahydrofolate--homocysteine methyltransferase